MKNVLILCLLLVAVSNAKDKFKDHSETREIQKQEVAEVQERQEAETEDDPFIDNHGNGTTFNQPENLN